MTEAAQIDRELRLYNLTHYLLTTPIEEIDFAATEHTLRAIAREQEAEHAPHSSE